MTLQEAIKKAETWRGSKVASVVDCGDRWAFTFEADYPKTTAVFDDKLPDFVKNIIAAPHVSHVFLFKDSGKFECFCVGDYVDLLRMGKKIPLPDK